ncbi:MAG: hypothetical protein GW795_04975 [Cyanobacteria bacterium]|nr:hypothetical protein [Cyanobacteria bacterium CG_2015-16_32_12]NCO79159.1 hypothetical protein [Cyanobacteria bacterium CG_2015-22_32_23]NCQ04876.1 hypothetical protein [Cyanobacteria bacterium CG_2015-09_32_10]NCQ41239.1 hypothetical protein [Cyanobacteria bacterium CG_2015-04_32_10]NCS84988.1 hypothetical protein [Cyanobacteria bacterium CG_2015-02_32_10]
MITIEQLESYSQKNSQEVLVIKAKENEEEVEIMIFKGFSSNLSGATNFDPDLPILSSTAQIITIDRLWSPYNPANPNYIQRGLIPSEFIHLMKVKP